MEITRQWPDASPEGVLVRAFRALVARDGRALAALASEESLAEYRANIHRDTAPQWHVWTAEALRRTHPGMPAAAAEWQAEQMARHREGHAAALLGRFSGVESLEALRALDAPALLDRALSAAPRGMTAIARLEVLGHVSEGPATAYVLYRKGWRDPDGELEPRLGTPELVTMRADGGEWRLELDTHGYFGMPGYGAIFYLGDDALPPGAEDSEDRPDAPAT